MYGYFFFSLPFTNSRTNNKYDVSFIVDVFSFIVSRGYKNFSECDVWPDFV